MTITAPRYVDTAADSAMPAAMALVRRRGPKRIVAAVLTIALGFLIGAVVLGRVNEAIAVLAMARAVSAGALLTDADLTTVSVAPGDGVHLIAATRRPEVVGQTAAVPLAAGALLTPEQFGAVTDPAAGQSILAVGVKTGRAPAGLSAGASVVVLVVPSGNAPGATTVQAPAVIRAVELPDSSGLTVVTVQMDSEAAVSIAAASGDVAIIVRGR